MVAERSRARQARAVPAAVMDALSHPSCRQDLRARELERRLLDAAEALLAHRGGSFALVPIPGRLPVRCVAIGELARIREMVRTENVYA